VKVQEQLKLVIQDETEFGRGFDATHKCTKLTTINYRLLMIR
jgi:hypothetical protein